MSLHVGNLGYAWKMTTHTQALRKMGSGVGWDGFQLSGRSVGDVKIDHLVTLNLT